MKKQGMLKIRILSLVVLLAVQCGAASEEQTWRLDGGKGLKALDTAGEDKFLAEAVHIKQLVNEGKTGKVKKAFKQFKKDYPELAGPDMDMFMKAEVFLSKGKTTKAVRSYDKLMDEYPESRFYESALSREYGIATAFLGGKKRKVLKIFKVRGYAEGARMMEHIADRTGDRPLAVRALISVAESLEKRKKFNDAYDTWYDISSRWPSGKVGRDSLLAMGRCKHASYRGPKFDSSNLKSARTYYEDYQAKYPDEAKELGIGKRIGQIKEQLAYKQFDIGEYYKGTESVQSSNLYYQMVIDDWPGSVASQKAEAAIRPKPAEEKKIWKLKLLEKIEKLVL